MHRARETAREITASPFVVLDTETTGLDDRAQIVSIAIIDQAGETLLHSLVRPSAPIPADATAIHGITDEMVASAPTMADLYGQVRALLEGRRVVIYNAEYDTRLLKQSIRAAHKGQPVTLPDEWRMRLVCAMELYSDYLGSDRWQKLTVAAEHFGISTAGAHGALADCRMTLGVVRGMAGQ
jgi:DNA polymerase-3 subunit epsilon